MADLLVILPRSSEVKVVRQGQVKHTRTHTNTNTNHGGAVASEGMRVNSGNSFLYAMVSPTIDKLHGLWCEIHQLWMPSMTPVLHVGSEVVR